MSSSLNTIDIDLALERAGGNRDLARELYQMLQKELSGYHDTITTHYRSGNLTSLLEVVHKLNGAATYCGVPALKEAAARFEGHLKSGETVSYATDLASVLDEIARLQQTPTLDV